MALATVVQAIAWAYIFGIEHGINSQTLHFKQLYEELHPELIVDFAIYFHPSRNILSLTTLSLILSWIAISSITIEKKLKSKSLLEPENSEFSI